VLRLSVLRLDQRLLVTLTGPAERTRAPVRVRSARLAAMAHRLIGIHHIQLAMPVGEEEAGRAFYGDILGLTEIPKPSELAPRGGIWFRSGELEVHLGVERADFRPATKAHPAFLVSGLDELRERLEDAGYRIDEDVQLEGFRRFHVRDPFGNRLELVEPA
jgi:catechol 2,3-dioxygenase-like lactoylglutathione lyase family enzyme